ncbi:hypothetical protein BDFB_009521 [Asbolus verrucosus]|uniref:Uncharacterized protein n=1 Tax=Asbolus verrucosus TaxID=1661398 RepID=A0A482VR27_ASBVE|nr:hypothetical protein BDFB_009521 [Asbolus verrucosus]
MKLELSDGMSNNSDFSNDSQNSQMSTADFMTSMGNGVLLTPTTTVSAAKTAPFHFSHTSPFIDLN